jgi:hypothetical protein
MKLTRTYQVRFCEITPLNIRGARPARLPLLKLSRKQAEHLPARAWQAGILWQAGELRK